MESLSAEIRAELLDPEFWQPRIEQFALATGVAAQFFDRDGRGTGACLNPQPVWKIFSTDPAPRGCPFSISSRRCTCLAEAFQRREAVFAREDTGFVHFVVPLAVGGQVLGGVLAGQVFDQFPGTLVLERIAREAGVEPERVWKCVRQARPVGSATVRVYAGLLTTLIRALLDTRHRNILERERAEQLRQAQKLETIGVLAGGVAHDFNNLLTGILGNASLIVEQLPPGHSVRDLAQRVTDAAQHAAGLTRQLLAYAGKGSFVVQRKDLSALIRETSDLIRASVRKEISLHLELADSLPPLEADTSQIEQVVMNLVINAAEALQARDKPIIVVRTGEQNVTPDDLEPAWSPEIRPGRYVFLEVEDTGSGMDEETQRKMFDPFFSTKFIGRGLGLAAVWGIVTKHRGAMKVHSIPGQGTTFRILFPASSEASTAGPRLVKRDVRHGAGLVLVVDDEPGVRQTAQDALKHLGYGVLVAENGETAVALFRDAAERVSLVLLDLTMPGLSSYETFLRLKSIRPEIKVLLSSGYNESEANSRFTGQDVAGFVQKPYTAAGLGEKVGAALQGRG